MLSVLNKIGSEYFVFVSTFHSGRDFIPNWKMPSLDSFAKSLIQEQENLVHMEVLQTSKNQALLMTNSALLMTDSTNAQDKGRHKGKEPKVSDSKPKESQKSSEGALRSKNEKKFEKTKCPYCMRGFHLENQCMKKQIDQLLALLKKNHISLPQRAKNSNDGKLTDDHESCHAFKASLSRSTTYLIDSGESNHMVSSKD